MNRREALVGLGAGVTVGAAGLSIAVKTPVVPLTGFDVHVIDHLHPRLAIELQHEINAMRAQIIKALAIPMRSQ